MKTTLYLFHLVLLLSSILDAVATSSNNEAFHRVPAFAGGFGASSAKKSKGKKSKKKRSSIMEEMRRPAPEEFKRDDIPQLDRFGLPIRTAENFFPPLPDDVELVSSKGKTTIELVQKSMSKHISLNYDVLDDDAVEKGSDNRNPWKLNLLHQSPPVLEIENFFTSRECQEYKSIAQTDDVLQVDSATFSNLATSKRTSTTWYCNFNQVPTLLAKAKHLLNDLPLEQMEEAQIVRYKTGQEFSWHYDEIPSTQLANGGQRIATLLVYLNTIENGGGTIFRDLKDAEGKGGELTMRPKEGSALLFFPAFADGTPDDRTLHKGEVAVDEKMIAQMWIHERNYTPVVPEGNSHEAARDSLRSKEIELGYIAE